MGNRFSDQFLDELRERVPVSSVVGKKVELKKEGHEFVGLSPFQKEKTPSFKVNDEKRFYHDFSSGKHGDVFSFLVEAEGLSFPEAVEEVAKIAGVPLPNGDAPSPARPNGRTHVGNGDERQVAARTGDHVSRPEPVEKPKKEIVACYDYTDPQGELIYQTVRQQFRLPDGSWELSKKGKPQKTFLQRRPNPDKPGEWIWNLEGIEHRLYRLVELRETGPDDSIYLPEGEAKADLLWEWGLAATCNSGGAKNWRGDHAQFFRGRDVVILIDNDKSGRDRGEMIANSLCGVARRIRILDFAEFWTGAPEGADIIDWKRAREGTAEELSEIVQRLPDWRPTPRESKFGLVMWVDQDLPGEEYEYIVEDLIPEAEPVLIIGESQSGKSFWTQELALSAARGVHFFGRRIHKPFGVVYCAYEAGKGFRNRLRAYRQFNGLTLEDIPFGVLTRPVNLWSEAVSTDQLIEEILWIVATKFNGVPLGAVVIDTHNRATAGASEIESKDIGQIIDRYTKIMRATAAGVYIIGHKNAAGRHRGNEQLYNTIETVIDISRQVQIVDKQIVPIRDTGGRWLRTAKVLKQREGEEGTIGEFVLGTVTVGTNKYGRARTSCVVLPVVDETGAQTEQERKQEAAKLRLSDKQATIFNALKTAVDELGIPPPAGLVLPRSITKVCTVKDWYEAYRKVAYDTSDAALKQAMKRANDYLLERRIIGRSNPYVWVATRKTAQSAPPENTPGDQTPWF